MRIVCISDTHGKHWRFDLGEDDQGERLSLPDGDVLVHAGDHTNSGKDGVWKDVWLEDKPPFAAKATIYKKNCEPFVSVALWSEYYGEKAANLQKKMPSHMLAKCAESLC